MSIFKPPRLLGVFCYDKDMGLFRKKALPEKAETYQGHEAFESFLAN